MKSSGNMPMMHPSVIPNADPELLAIRTEARRSCDGLVAGGSEWRGEQAWIRHCKRKALSPLPPPQGWSC